MVMNEVQKVKTLEVPYESLLYLREECHIQRIETVLPLSEKTKDKMKRNMPSNGLCIVYDGDFGGCNGDPKNAWKERRWTTWDVDTMIAMLDKVNLPYGKVSEAEQIAVYI